MSQLYCLVDLIEARSDECDLICCLLGGSIVNYSDAQELVYKKI